MKIYSGRNSYHEITFACRECLNGNFDDFKEIKTVSLDCVRICTFCRMLLSEKLNAAGLLDLRNSLTKLSTSELEKVLALGLKVKICQACLYIKEINKKTNCAICKKSLCNDCVYKCDCKKRVCRNHRTTCECAYAGCRPCVKLHETSCKILVTNQKNRDKGRFTRTAFRFASDIEGD